MTTSSATTPQAEGGQRRRWPDVAKGACILLVVLHHVILKDYIFLVGTAFDHVEDAWRGFTYGLKPVRMPLFFVVSGFFAAGAVARPWRASWRRIISGYYLYVVWLTVFIGVYALDQEIPANRVTSVADLLGELVWAASSLWFLYALVVYFVVAKAVRRLPPALVIAAAGVLAVSVSWLGIEENNRFSVLLHLVYFLFGAFYPRLLRRIASLRATLPALVGLAVAYAGAAWFALTGGLPWSAGAVAASLIGIPLGVLLAVRVADTRLGAGLAWVGQRSLRIYVLHLAVLVALVQLPHHLGERGALGLAAAIGYPVVMSALVVLGCFAVHRVLVLLGAGWLFSLPTVLDQRLAAAAVAPAGTGQPAPAEPAEPVEPVRAAAPVGLAKVPNEPTSGIAE